MGFTRVAGGLEAFQVGENMDEGCGVSLVDAVAVSMVGVSVVSPLGSHFVCYPKLAQS